MGFAKPIEQYLLGNYIHVFMYLKDIIRGMLENDQKEQYVEKGSEFDHIFKINKNGYYQLYMENKSKDKVTFAGAYSVHEKDEEE